MFHLDSEEISRLVENSLQPSIQVCLSREEEILTRAAEVKGDDGWEISVSCQIKKHKETPASLPPIDKDDDHDH